MTQNDGEYIVGYRRPPKASQFAQGKSGNPRGRPRGTPNLATVLQRTLREKVIISENGRRRMVTKLEAAISQLANNAVSGDGQAVKYLCQLVRSVEEQSVPVEPTTQLSETDRKVWDNILRRFHQPSKENSDDTDQE